MPATRVTARLVICALLALCVVPQPDTAASPVQASPGNGLKIVDLRGETPVVNEGGKLDLKVIDAAGNTVAARSWSSDNPAIGKVNRRRGKLTGRAFGFAVITAQTDRGPASGFVVCARVRRQGGAMAQGDTKADTGGNVYLSSPSAHVVYRSDGLTANIFAGTPGTSGYIEDTGTAARFNVPTGLGVDNRAEGGIYIADTANHCIRKVDFRGRSSLAVGTPRFSGTMFGDEAPLGEAIFSGPRGVTAVGSNLYVTDTENHCIWYVDAQRSKIYLVAGEPGELGLVNGVGRNARLNRPSGIAINRRGDLLAVADAGNGVIRLVGIAPKSGGGIVGTVTTLGQASSARVASIAAKLRDDRGEDILIFDEPESVSFDSVDNVYVVDRETASVVTRGGQGFVERVDLAQFGTLGDPASVTVRGTRAFVLDQAATSEATAVNVVQVGAPVIDAVTPDLCQLAGTNSVVVVRGANFAPEAQVTLGDTEITDFRVDSSRQITIRSIPPQRAPGRRTLTVSTRGGTDQVQFFVIPPTLAEIGPGEITTIAGGVLYSGDGGPAQEAQLVFPRSITLDAAGNAYVAQADASRIRRIDADGGITTFAGNGAGGYSGDGGPASAATLGYPYGTAIDGAGNLYIADSNNNVIRRVEAQTARITTVVGTGAFGFGGDGGPAPSAVLGYPTGIVVDATGNLYIVDSVNCRVRYVDAATGKITTMAGTGVPGSTGDGGLATAATLNRPFGIAVDEAGNVFVSEADGHRVRRIDAVTKRISRYAGTGEAGFADGVAATLGKLSSPRGLALDASGNLYIADFANKRVRRVSIETGLITTFAGNGEDGYSPDGTQATSAPMGEVNAVAVDGAGNVYIVTSSHRLYRVAMDGRITAMAGTFQPAVPSEGQAVLLDIGPGDLAFDSSGRLLIAAIGGNCIHSLDLATGFREIVVGSQQFGNTGDGGPALTAEMRFPSGLAIDRDDNIFVAEGTNVPESGNNRVRRVDAATKIIDAYAGTGAIGYTGDDGLATAAAFRLPQGLAVDASGNLYIADFFNNAVRRVDAETHVITTFAGTGEFGFSGDDGPANQARLTNPWQLAFDTAGDLLITDIYNNRIRKVEFATGKIRTVAGSGVYGYNGEGVPASQVRMAGLNAVAVDGEGNIFYSETSFLGSRVRRIDARTGLVTTIAGGTLVGYDGDGGPASSSHVNHALCMVFDSAGNLFLADRNNTAVRVIKGAGAPRARVGTGP